MQVDEKTKLQKEIIQTEQLVQSLKEERMERYRKVQSFTVSHNETAIVMEGLRAINSKIKTNENRLRKLQKEWKKLN